MRTQLHICDILNKSTRTKTLLSTLDPSLVRNICETVLEETTRATYGTVLFIPENENLDTCRRWATYRGIRMNSDTPKHDIDSRIYADFAKYGDYPSMSYFVDFEPANVSFELLQAWLSHLYLYIWIVSGSDAKHSTSLSSLLWWHFIARCSTN